MAALEGGSIPAARAVLRSGAPAALRPRLWRLALGLEDLRLAHRDFFEQLCEDVEQRQFFTDLLVRTLLALGAGLGFGLGLGFWFEGLWPLVFCGFG